jgi:hypothetical protein
MLSAITISNCHFGDTLAHSLCGSLLDKRNCLSGNDWNCSDQNVCDHANLPALFSTHHEIPSPLPDSCRFGCPNDHPDGLGDCPNDHPGDHGDHRAGPARTANLAPVPQTDWIDPAQPQIPMPTPKQTRISSLVECSSCVHLSLSACESATEFRSPFAEPQSISRAKIS